MDYKEIRIRTVKDPDPVYGGLGIIESGRDIPFDIKRIYFIFKAEEGIHRGLHAHKENRQLLFCPYGKIEIVLDDGAERQSVLLDEPSKGLILYPGLWREMIWRQTGSVLCVAASEYYDPDDYIRSYEDFKTYKKSIHKKENGTSQESLFPGEETV